jgi:hypothetical protein
MIKEIKEKSVIEMCIIRSKEIMKMKKALVVQQNATREVLSCSRRFASEDKLKEVEREIKNTIIEFEMSIALMLKPIMAVHGIHLDDKFWFTLNEIRNGYVLFRKPNSLGATHVLFLRDQTDSFDNSKVSEGDIKLYKHVNHFLERLDAEIELKKAQKKSKANEQNT